MATTVTLLLVVVLVQVFNGAAGSWRHSEAQVDAYREARGALQLMAHDLSATLQASYAQDGGNDLAMATNTKPAMPTLALQHYSSPDTSGPTNEEVYCLTNITNHGASSLCAVGYFCQWMADDSTFPVTGTSDQRPRAYALMRQSLDSNGTYQRIQAAASHTPLTFLDLYSRNTTSVASNASPPLAVATQVAAYVWDLRFRIDTDLNDSANGGVTDGNATQAAPDHSTNPIRYYNCDAGPSYPSRLPPYVEIRFKALSSIAGRRLEGNGAITSATWADTATGFSPAGPYQQIIQPNYQQFVLRVPLINATPLPTPGT